MNKADQYYKKNLELILSEGCIDQNPRPKYKDGTPAHTKYISQVFEEYDLTKGEFPIPTIRNTAIRTGIKEVLWIYQRQSSKISDARSLGVNWWESWDIGDGTIGQRYGATVGKWNLMDELLDGLVNDPFGRRHIINLYQYSDLKETKGLHPCAYETLFTVREVEGIMFLDMTLVQRSNDYIMAGYINKIQYVALLMMVAAHCGYTPGKFCHFVQNLHIYDRHFEAVKELLGRPISSIQPTIELKRVCKFGEYTVDDFIIKNDYSKKITSELEIAI